MGWVYLDDQFPDHPKVVAAGPIAAWLYVAGLAYCKRYGTSGTIPKVQIPRLIDHRTAREQARKLVASGLWIDADSAYRVHDWDDWNRDANARSEAGRKAAQARWSRHRSDANGNAAASESHPSAMSIASLASMRGDAQSPPIPSSNPSRAYSRRPPDPVAETQAAARARAEQNMATVRAIANTPPNAPAVLSGLVAARAAIHQPKYDPQCEICAGYGWTIRDDDPDVLDGCPKCNPPAIPHGEVTADARGA